MADKYEKQYDLLTRGVGPHGSVGAESDGEGFFSRCSTTMYDRRLGPYLGDVKEGGVVVDKWNVPFGKGANLVVNGPMVKLGLPPGTIEKFSETISDVMLMGLEGEFQTMAQHKHKNPKWSGFDYISLDLYLDLWRRAGARIGKRIGNEIQWDDGTVSQIPNEDQRYLPAHEVDVVLERE